MSSGTLARTLPTVPMSSLYPRSVPYISECSARKYNVPFLKSLVRRDLGLNLGLPEHWHALYPLCQCLHFTLEAYLIFLSVKQGSIKYHF